METGVIKTLADAAESLQAAQSATRHGFVSDHCENALEEIRKAIRMATSNDGQDDTARLTRLPAST